MNNDNLKTWPEELCLAHDSASYFVPVYSDTPVVKYIRADLLEQLVKKVLEEVQDNILDTFSVEGTDKCRRKTINEGLAEIDVQKIVAGFLKN